MKIVNLQIGDVFTDKHGTKVKVSGVIRDDDKLRCTLTRIEGHLKNSGYIDCFEIDSDGNALLENYSDYIPYKS